MSWRIVLITMIFGLAIAFAGLNSRHASLIEASAAADQSIKVWEPRLESLKPSNPNAYFELAEEVADAAPPADVQQRELARHLFALSGVLDPEHLGRSACLALADLEEDANAKRRLLALASLLGPGGIGGPALNAAADRTAESMPQAVLAVSEAFSRYRTGKGPQALTALRKPGATELLQRYERLLPGGLARFVEDCKLYHGQLKPTLSTNDVVHMLRFEQALLDDINRSWSGELLLTDGPPLAEVDPARLEESLGIDASKPVYRRGKWVKS